jgi:hypothetical protein
MTPQQLKAAMEEQWIHGDCVDPLAIVSWRVTLGGLLPNHDSFVLDEDERDPACAQPS